MANFVLKRGLKDIYAAEITYDDNSSESGHGYITDTPFQLIPAGEMSRTTNSDKTDVYFDDTVFATVGREEATEITISGAALSPTALARITNKAVDATTGAILDAGDFSPKYFAIGGTTETVEGQTEKFWFLKGTFSIPEQNDKTIDDTTDTNGITLTFSAIKTSHKFDGGVGTVKAVIIDSTKTTIKSQQSWEAQVVTPDNVSTVCQKVV